MTHSLILNKDDQVICNFCNDPCEIYMQEWWKCLTCHVWYNTSTNVINFFIQENNRMYSINILLKENKSKLYNYNDGRYDLITTFDHLLNITPQTLSNKLKTYLLFL